MRGSESCDEDEGQLNLYAVISQVTHARVDARKLSGEGGSVSVTLTAPFITPAVLTTTHTAVRHVTLHRAFI